MTGAVGISAGILHSCAALDSGAVRCWGNNASGQLGNGTTTNSNVPVPVVGIP
jgi:alpha-tubulin suppressor-like RCC1 family protein